MTRSLMHAGLAALLLISTPAAAQTPAPTPPDPQTHLEPVVDVGGEVMEFDWPALNIGIAEYPEGPTGVTVFTFGRKVQAAVDVRGGAPGTVNTDLVRLGYSTYDYDAVVFAGGSAYGLEATTAVASALKDDGHNTGVWDSIAVSLGAIIYDFGSRRLNEIYPDKRLAQAAYRASRPGVFRNGSAGAGRMTRTGDFFGCRAHSGQGGAFRQIGDLKIAVFTVVNAWGVVTDREGQPAACYRDPSWPEGASVSDMLAHVPESRDSGAWQPDTGRMRNTTITLVAVNRQMEPALLERLAIQVHTAMGRSIQPFATSGDGDVLYAITTGEIEAFDPEDADAIDDAELGVIASELAWDAVLASVPEQPALPVITEQPAIPVATLESYVGEYRFSNFVSVRITRRGNRLFGRATGVRPAFNVPMDRTVELIPYEDGQFAVPGRYPTVLQFRDAQTLVFNPGQWAQTGVKVQ